MKSGQKKLRIMAQARRAAPADVGAEEAEVRGKRRGGVPLGGRCSFLRHAGVAGPGGHERRPDRRSRRPAVRRRAGYGRRSIRPGRARPATARRSTEARNGITEALEVRCEDVFLSPRRRRASLIWLGLIG
jgi:hypothetical protein